MRRARECRGGVVVDRTTLCESFDDALGFHVGNDLFYMVVHPVGEKEMLGGVSQNYKS